MAYEGLSRALIQIANDYGNAAEAERERARIRSEKLADRDDERAYQKQRDEENANRQVRVAKELSELNLEMEVKRAERLAPVQRRQELLKLATLAGVEGDYTAMDDAALAGAIRVKDRENKKEDTVAAGENAVRAKRAGVNVLLNDPEYKKVLEVKVADYKKTESQLKALEDRLGASPELSQIGGTTPALVAQKYVDDFLASKPKSQTIAEELMKAGVMVDISKKNPPSPDALGTMLRNNAEAWATATKRKHVEEAKIVNDRVSQRASAELRQAIGDNQLMRKRLYDLRDELSEFAINPDELPTTANTALQTQTQTPVVPSAPAAPVRTGPTLGSRVQGIATPPPAQPASGAALAPPRAGPIPFGPEIAPEDRGSPASGAALVPPPPTRTASISQPPTALGSEKIDYGMPFTSNVQPIQTPKGSSFWQFAGNEAGNAAKYGTAVARDLVYNAGVAFQNSRADEAPPSGMLPRQEAEAWLQQNGVQLDPQTKSQLISQYEMIASSTLPLEQKGAKVRELQQLAIANDFRSKAWAPRQ